MDDRLGHLASSIEAVQREAETALRSLEKQSERETRALEEAEQGDDFDPDGARLQDVVVSALSTAIEQVDQAVDALSTAARALREAR